MSGASGSGRPGRAHSPTASPDDFKRHVQQSGTTLGGQGNQKDPAPIDKTISCVSCRKRKLKCDRVKPKCGTCTRMRHECEYPERKKNLGSKRRNMKELEARLAQVETQLVAESKNGAPTSIATASSSVEAEWNTFSMDMTLDIGETSFLDSGFGMPQAGDALQINSQALQEEDIFSQELIALGLREPLPPQDMRDELNKIYFEKVHQTCPLIHRFRYYASLDRAPNMRPPVCLMYIIWAMAASVTQKYMCYEDVLYERARTYIHEAEMKGHGEGFISIYYAQAWNLIANFEAKKTYFSRAWMSMGRAIRMTHMLGLHRLDGDSSDFRSILPAPRDWIELEERRRTFWAAFYGDRWSSSGTGWPMIIDEKEILTNLPSSEVAFETGVRQETTSLEEALTPQGAAQVSTYGGVVLSAALFGHNFSHLHRTGPNERPDDVVNGEFWKRHRKMDNVLLNTFMFLPEHLRLPGGIRDMHVVFLHMNIHVSTICLHQAATLTLERNQLGADAIRKSRARSLMAAEEIVNIMRLVSHIDASNMNSWMGFTLYVAGGVIIQDAKSNEPQPQSISNLEFLLAAMQAIGKQHPITHHFTAQLELDIKAAGIGRLSNLTPAYNKDCLSNVPKNGIFASPQGVPMDMATANLSFFAKLSTPAGLVPLGSNSLNTSLTPLYGTLPTKSSSPSSQNSPESQTTTLFPNRNPHVDATVSRRQSTATDLKTRGFTTGVSSAFSPPIQKENFSASGEHLTSFDQPDPSAMPGNTPSSDSSGSNTLLYPYRSCNPVIQPPTSHGLFQFEHNMDPNFTSADTSEWGSTRGQTAFENDVQPEQNLDTFLEGQMWSHDSGQG